MKIAEASSWPFDCEATPSILESACVEGARLAARSRAPPTPRILLLASPKRDGARTSLPSIPPAWPAQSAGEPGKVRALAGVARSSMVVLVGMELAWFACVAVFGVSTRRRSRTRAWYRRGRCRLFFSGRSGLSTFLTLWSF